MAVTASRNPDALFCAERLQPHSISAVVDLESAHKEVTRETTLTDRTHDTDFFRQVTFTRTTLQQSIYGKWLKEIRQVLINHQLLVVAPRTYCSCCIEISRLSCTCKAGCRRHFFFHNMQITSVFLTELVSYLVEISVIMVLELHIYLNSRLESNRFIILVLSLWKS